ncbi:MAG: hypothetical protein KGQ89_01065, partial [Verrucomicrobia bacterium]|nr:hypothetical protein [Verrucomicrobiota bacterium]
MAIIMAKRALSRATRLMLACELDRKVTADNDNMPMPIKVSSTIKLMVRISVKPWGAGFLGKKVGFM